MGRKPKAPEKTGEEIAHERRLEREDELLRKQEEERKKALLRARGGRASLLSGSALGIVGSPLGSSSTSAATAGAPVSGGSPVSTSTGVSAGGAGAGGGRKL